MALWTPANAASPHAWYKAKSSADYTLAGGTVTAIADKLGLGHGASGRNGCGFSATGLDGTNPAFTFNGGLSQSLDMAVSAKLPKVCYAILVNYPAGYQTFCGANNTDSYDFHIDGSNNVCLDMFQDRNLVQVGGFTPNTPQVILVTRDTSTSVNEVRINGTSVITSTYSFPLDASPDNHILGAVYNRDYANGAIAELVILTDYDDATLQQLESYILWDWGYQSLLPVGHTYKTAAPTFGSSGTAQSLAAAAADITTATANLAVAKNLAASAADIVTSTANLSTQVQKQLAATGTDAATATAGLAVGKPLAASGADNASATAVLSIAKALSAAATDIATASAALIAVGGLSATGSDTATGTANLSVGKALSGAATDVAVATALLDVNKQLSAIASDISSATAALSVVVSGNIQTLSAGAQDVVTATAAMKAAYSLAASAQDIVTATANIIAGTTVHLSASALDVVTATARISTGKWEVVDEVPDVWSTILDGVSGWNTIH